MANRNSFCDLTGHLQTKELKYSLKKCSHCKTRYWLRLRKMVQCIACKCVMHAKCMAEVNRWPVCRITIEVATDEWNAMYSERPSVTQAQASAAATVPRDDAADGEMAVPQVTEPRKPADDMEVLRRGLAGLRGAQDDLESLVAAAETVGKLLWMVEADEALETRDGQDDLCPAWVEPADSGRDRLPITSVRTVH